MFLLKLITSKLEIKLVITIPVAVILSEIKLYLTSRLHKCIDKIMELSRAVLVCYIV